MTPTSSAQWQAAEDGSVPGLEVVRERLWALGVPMPAGQRGLAYSLTYLLLDEDGRLHIVDPGYSTTENWVLLRDAMERVAPGADLASVIITHLHPDHMGMAEQLRTETGARVVMHELEQQAMRASSPSDPLVLEIWGVPAAHRAELEAVLERPLVLGSVDADVLLHGADDRLDIRGWNILAVHTPGHTRGSISLRMPDLGVVLTGDHVLPNVFPGVGLGGPSETNPIADYLDSLDRVAAFDDEVLPGHGYRFRGIAERCRELGDHHRRRTAEVAEAIGRAPGATVWDIATTLTWSVGWGNLSGFLLLSALAQTAMHVELVRG